MRLHVAEYNSHAMKMKHRLNCSWFISICKVLHDSSVLIFAANESIIESLHSPVHSPVHGPVQSPGFVVTPDTRFAKVKTDSLSSTKMLQVLWKSKQTLRSCTRMLLAMRNTVCGSKNGVIQGCYTICVKIYKAAATRFAEKKRCYSLQKSKRTPMRYKVATRFAEVKTNSQKL